MISKKSAEKKSTLAYIRWSWLNLEEKSENLILDKLSS